MTLLGPGTQCDNLRKLKALTTLIDPLCAIGVRHKAAGRHAIEVKRCN